MNAVAKWFIDLVHPAPRDSGPPAASTPIVQGKVSAERRDIREAFFNRPDDSDEKRTALQDKMQSGGY